MKNFTFLILALIGLSHNTATSAIQFVGDYKNTEINVDLVAKFLSVPGFDTIPTTLNELGERQYEYISGVFSNFKVFMDQSYLTAKGKLITIQTCIFLGIYAGLVLFLGLLMFLLTRGKKNFNRYLKWYQCMFISFWSSVSPGILALIFSFLMPNMSLIFFIMFMGVRAMWIAMKQLSPTYSK